MICDATKLPCRTSTGAQQTPGLTVQTVSLKVDETISTILSVLCIYLTFGLLKNAIWEKKHRRCRCSRWCRQRENEHTKKHRIWSMCVYKTVVLGVGSMDGTSGMCCLQATLQMGGCSCQRVCPCWAQTPWGPGRGCPSPNWWWKSPHCSSPRSWSPERTWRVSCYNNMSFDIRYVRFPLYRIQ